MRPSLRVLGEKKILKLLKKKSFREFLGYEKKEDTDLIRILSNVDGKELLTYTMS